MDPKRVSPPPELVGQHVEAILGSQTFAESQVPKTILPYMVDRALAGDRVTLFDIADDVFHKHDEKTVQKVKTAKKNLKLKLLEYYGKEGRDEPIRIVFPKRGLNLSLQWSLASPRTGLGGVAGVSLRSRVESAVLQRADEVAFFVEGLPDISDVRHAPWDIIRRRHLFKEVFEPAYQELRAVHSDYLRMFLSARASMTGKIDPEFVRPVTQKLQEQRLVLEAVRLELRFLFLQLKDGLSEYPVACQFTQIAFEYVAPPRGGTNAFNLIHRLNAHAESSRIDIDFKLAAAVRESIDEELDHIRTLMRLITKAYVTLKLATLL